MPGGPVAKNSPINAGNMCSIPCPDPHAIWGSWACVPQIQNPRYRAIKLQLLSSHVATNELYTNNQLLEREIKKIVPFTSASTRIKYLGTNLTEEIKDLKLKKTQTDGKTYHANELEELILLKWPYYSKQSTDSMQRLSKYP